MNETLRHEIVQRRQAGMSERAIARELGITRGAVRRVLARLQAQREGQTAPVPRPRPRPRIDPSDNLRGCRRFLRSVPRCTPCRPG